MNIQENYIKKFWPFSSLKGIRESAENLRKMKENISATI
jgi:hypothetical protein